MNILVISNMFPNKHFPTSGIFVHEQVKSLVSLGSNVTIVSPIPYVFPFFQLLSEKWEKYKSINIIEELDGKKVYHPKFIAIPGGRLKQYWYLVLFLTSKKLIKKLHSEHNFDLIHIQGNAPDDYTGFKLSKLLKIPFILTIHGDSVLALAQNKRRFKNSKIAIEKASAVIAVSSKVENKIFVLTKRKKDVFVIHNGYSKVKNSTIVKVKDSKFVTILFVGNLIPQKGCKNLILAIKKVTSRFKNIKLQIVGAGPEVLELKELIQKLNLAKVVTFWGSKSHDEVLRFMQTCDIFVLPSVKEAFGVVYLEAMSFKKPVIASKGEGINDLIVDGENGLLVDAHDIGSIVEKLEILIGDKRKRIELGEAGFNTIENLTWENNARENIEIYNIVLNKLNH